MEWFENRRLKWEEIEEAFVKRRQTWEKALKSTWVEEERDRYFTNAHGVKMKRRYLYKGPSYPITDHFIHDVTTYMAQEGFNIQTAELVDAIEQGLSVQPDHNAEYYADEGNPVYQNKTAEEKERLLAKARQALENHEVEYLGMWQSPTDPEDFDANWFERFPLVSFGNDKETLYNHEDRVELWCLDFEEFVLGEEAEKRGRTHKRVKRRQQQKRRRDQEFNEALTVDKVTDVIDTANAKAKSEAVVEAAGAPHAVEVDTFLGAAKNGFVEVISAKQPVHTSMLDEEGRFHFTVSVQYVNVGTEEAPQWVKTEHHVQASKSLAQTGHRS